MNQDVFKQLRFNFPIVDNTVLRNVLSQQKDQNLLISLVFILKRFKETIVRMEDIAKFVLAKWEQSGIQIPKELHEEILLDLVESKFYYQAMLANGNSQYLNKNNMADEVQQLSTLSKSVNDLIAQNYSTQRPYHLNMDEVQEQQSKKTAQTPKMPQLQKGQRVYSLTLNIQDREQVDKLYRSNKQYLSTLGIKMDCPKSTTGTQTEQIDGLQPLGNKKNKKEEQNKDMRFYEYQQEIAQCIQYLPTYETVEQLTQDIGIFVAEIDQYNKKNRAAFQKLIDEISAVVSGTYPGANVDVYGSYATELCLPHSDIDLVIKIPNQHEKFVPDILQRIEQEFKKCKFIEETKCVTQSTTPVLRAKCSKQYMNKRLDISIQETKHNGLSCVQLIKKYIKIYEPLKPLTLIMKQFLHKSDLSDTYSGGLSSYGLILMIVSFLQSYQNQEKSWPTMGTLLIEFLNVYGCELDYAGKTICPELPDVFEPDATIIFDPHNFVYCSQQSLVIIDPLNQQNNVGRPSYNVAKIKLAFTVAFAKLLTFDAAMQFPLKYFLNCAQNIQYSLHSVLVNQYKAYADQIMYGIILYNMNWDFINRKLKEFFEQRRQQSIDKIFTLSPATDFGLPKKQFLEMETQVTEDPKQMVQSTLPITLATPKKVKQTPKSFNQISHLFSPHGPARSTASMQVRQIVASTLKNESNSYNSVRTKDIRRVQELVCSLPKKAHSKQRRITQQKVTLSSKILSEFDDLLDSSPVKGSQPSASLQSFVTQTKTINTLAMRAQLRTKAQGSLRMLQQPSPAIDNFSKMAFEKSSDPRVGLDRFLSNKWLQFVIEQKSMRKDDQFDDYLQQYNTSPAKEKNIETLKQKQSVRHQFNGELQQQIFKPHRYTPKHTNNKDTSQLVKSYSQAVYQIEKKKDDEELIEFYPGYYEKRVRRRRIIRKLRVLARRAIKARVLVSQLLERHQSQLMPYQQPGSVAFLRFVKYNHISAVKQLLDSDPALIGSFDEFGQQAIHIAAMIVSLDMVKLLLCNGANVNAEDLFLQKPLYFALINNNLPIIRLLLACRATPWDLYLRDYFAVCQSEETKNWIKLAQYMRIANEDSENILNVEDVKLKLSQY